MNAESSRSHSIFGIEVDVFLKTTKRNGIGKLSLIDLAGSERAKKTGATKEQLKEATSINKSLSALGDVIHALSTGEGFIPYRNNKLTQLMQDSLGGNAKTLMFVNISPADYNCDETCGALTYATRTKVTPSISDAHASIVPVILIPNLLRQLITNDAKKTNESEEVHRLKRVILQLQAGVPMEAIEGGDTSDLAEAAEDQDQERNQDPEQDQNFTTTA